LKVDPERAEEGEDCYEAEEVNDLFFGGRGGEEFAAEVGGVAAGAGDGGSVSVGVGFGFAESETRVGDPDGGDQEEGS
jgi:hypothetical protein